MKMKKNFTKLVSLAAASLCVLSVVGQERVPAMMVGETQVELRAEETRPQRDSIIKYSYADERISKYDDALGICYEWKNDSWVSNDEYSPCVGLEYGYYAGGVMYEVDGDKHFFNYPMSYYSTYYFRNDLTDIGSNASDFEFETVYNSNQQLTKLTMTFVRNGDINEWVREISYNEQGSPLSIDYNRNGTLVQKVDYHYLPDGIHCYLFEEWNLHIEDERVETIFGDNGEVLSVSWWRDNSNRYKYEFSYNDYSQKTSSEFYIGFDDRWVLSEYTLSYYSDEATKNGLIESPSAFSYLIDRTLYVRSETAERIEIYSITGAKLYEATISAGTTTIATGAFPQGVLIVKGNGWAKKVVN